MYTENGKPVPNSKSRGGMYAGKRITPTEAAQEWVKYGNRYIHYDVCRPKGKDYIVYKSAEIAGMFDQSKVQRCNYIGQDEDDSIGGKSTAVKSTDKASGRAKKAEGSTEE